MGTRRPRSQLPINKSKPGPARYEGLLQPSCGTDRLTRDAWYTRDRVSQSQRYSPTGTRILAVTSGIALSALTIELWLRLPGRSMQQRRIPVLQTTRHHERKLEPVNRNCKRVPLANFVNGNGTLL
jgi:hypothetical protein